MELGAIQNEQSVAGGATAAIPNTSDDPLLDPVGNALDSTHAHFAIGSGLARRYPADVAPFAVLADASPESFAGLAELLAPGERIYLLGEEPRVSNGLAVGEPLHTFQMIGPERIDVQTEVPGEGRGDIARIEPVLLGSQDAAAMFELITLAFPGFYRPRTYEMGTCYGIYLNGDLVAMAGERLCITGLREISGVCTRPGHTGKGYANALMARLLREHVAMAVKSFLHVGQSNGRAVGIYEQMGFRTLRSITLWPVSLAR
jgi:ribosomal protein S18 acetylase RimI-like enzyme